MRREERLFFQMTGLRPASLLTFQRSRRRMTLSVILFMVSTIALLLKSYARHSQMCKQGRSISCLSNGCGKILWTDTKNEFLMSSTPLTHGWKLRTVFRGFRKSLGAHWNVSSQVSCYFPTPLIWQTLGLRKLGHYICISEI
jgi:hypothetical protein